MKSLLPTAALLAAPVLAASSSMSCRTELGHSSVHSIPTGTTTITNAIRPTHTQTVQPTVTTYVGYFYTFTHFTHETDYTTLSTVTDNFTSTSTVYDVITDSFTSTMTVTTTQTVSTATTSTTEVATTPGFVPIADSLNSYTYQKRGVHPHANLAAAAPKQNLLTSLVPTKVDCTVTKPNTQTETVFTTVKAVTTSIPYIAFTTLISTLSSTSTIVPPDVSTTFTQTSTSSVTTSTTIWDTATNTATTTTTGTIPGPTVYDACAANNIFGPDFTNNGTDYYAVNVGNNGPGVQSDYLILSNGATTAEACCYDCQQSKTCETFIFRARYESCFLLYHPSESCSSQSNHPNFILSSAGSDTGLGYVVGNGNCGFTYSANSDGTVFSVDQSSLPS